MSELTMPGGRQCEDVEILLADYFDGTLAEQDQAEVDAHLAHCVACTDLARDASAAVAMLSEAPEIEVPPVVIRQILAATTQRPKPGFLAQVFGNGFGFSLPKFSFANLARAFRYPLTQRLTQPRWAMGFAMAALSLVMVGRFWGAAEHAAYRAWDRTVSRTLDRTLDRGFYQTYEKLAGGYDVQNQLDEWRAQLGGDGRTQGDRK